MVSILDAKYRDLWSKPLPPAMLYQLALYALSHEGGTATILYPSEGSAASESRLEVRDPVTGARRAVVALRPVDLKQLDALVHGPPSSELTRQTEAYARRLALGEANP